MNKKFSTLMTAGFLMVGALFSNVNAQTELANGAKIVDGQMYYLGASTTSLVGAERKASSENDGAKWIITPKTGVSTFPTAALFKAKVVNAGGVSIIQFETTVIEGAGTSGEKSYTGYLSFDANGAVYTTPNDAAVKGALYGFANPGDYVNGTGVVLALNGIADKGLAGDGTAGDGTDEVKIYLPDNASMSVGELNAVLGGNKGFGLKFPTTDPAIANNPFASRNIQAITYGGSTYLKTSGAVATATAATPKEFAAAEFIVLDTIPLTADGSSDFGGKKGAGYQFKIVKGSDMLILDGVNAASNQDARKRNPENAQFAISRNINNIDSLIIEVVAPKFGFDTKKAVKDHVTVAAYNLGVAGGTAAAGDDKVRVSIVNFAGQNYVTTYNDATTSKFDVVPTRWSLITFGASNIVARKDMMGIVNIANANTIGNTAKKANVGKVMGPEAEWALPSNVQLSKPEGQFRITSTADGSFKFSNRESGDDYSVTNLRTTEVAGVYTESTGDTIKITPVTVTDKFMGYKNYSKDLQLENTSFTIAVYSAVTDNVYLTEKHSTDHLMGLTTTAADATEWRLVKFEDGKSDALAASDTLKAIGDITYKDGSDFKLKDDSVVMFAYALYNEAVGEYMMYDADKKAFYCDHGTSKITDARLAAKFIVKEKADGMYNLVYVAPQTKTDDVYAAYSFGDEKLYGAFSENKVNKLDIYEYTDNDLFVIEPVKAPKYRTVATFDTVKVYRENNNKELLYENTPFLGIKNIAQFDTIKPAMFVDTAYVRNATNKPQYMLVMNPDKGSIACNDPSHLRHDSIVGRYLVNLVDSAKLYAGLHNNKYQWDGWSKLGFVNACHKNDKLYITRANGIAQLGDTLNVGEDNKNSVAKFAFRFVDNSQSAFKMETSLDGSKESIGYIKYHNGVPVVVPSINEAEVFNMTDTNENPTDNEGIETTEVSVIAGNGSVTINNAAGKTIAISNILGQAIANTVLSSDNETIAVSAGIVVVAVEGEAAVKAIVK